MKHASNILSSKMAPLRRCRGSNTGPDHLSIPYHAQWVSGAAGVSRSRPRDRVLAPPLPTRPRRQGRRQSRRGEHHATGAAGPLPTRLTRKKPGTPSPAMTAALTSSGPRAGLRRGCGSASAVPTGRRQAGAALCALSGSALSCRLARRLGSLGVCVGPPRCASGHWGSGRGGGPRCKGSIAALPPPGARCAPLPAPLPGPLPGPPQHRAGARSATPGRRPMGGSARAWPAWRSVGYVAQDVSGAAR